MKKNKSKIIIIFILLIIFLILLSALIIILRLNILPSKFDKYQQNNIYKNEIITDNNQSIIYSPYLYHYSLLDDDEKKIYNDMYSSVLAFNNKATFITTLNVDDIFKIYKCIRNDHPEIFWVDGEASIDYLEVSDLYKHTITFNYLISYEQASSMILEINDIVNPIVNNIYNYSNYEKIKYVYEYLTYNVSYIDSSNCMDYQIYNAIVNNSAVCAGYAKAFQYILSYFNIEVIYCSGVIKDSNENHAWNLVKIDDEWYQVDSTWGDLESNNKDYISYSYLLITDDEMLIDRDYNNDFYYPKCYSVKNNYYVKENKLLYKYDLKTIKNLLINDYNYEKPLSFKCSNNDLFNETYFELFDNGRIWSILRQIYGDFSISECSVRINETTNTIDIIM